MSSSETITSEVPASAAYRGNIPVQQEVDYNKQPEAGYSKTDTAGYPTTSYPTGSYPSVGYQVPASTTTAPTWETLNQTVPNVTIFLRPIAAPSALGWMSYFAGTFMLFTYYADWYGGGDTYIDIAPFLFFFGGLCQLVAGFHGYNARDNFATVWFTIWGSFFLAWSYYEVFLLPDRYPDSTTNVPAIPRHAENQGLGMWFVILTAVSWGCLLPAAARDITSGVIVLFAAIGCTLEMAFFSRSSGMRNTVKAGAYFLLFSGVMALFRSWLYLLEEAFFETHRYRFPGILINNPLESNKSPVSVGVNEPGVKKGQ